MDLHLENKTVLLIGGTRGIGRAAARLLAEEGALVALVARDPRELDSTASELRAAGGEAMVIESDITEPEQAEKAVALAATKLGGCDILIQAAGKGFPIKFMEADEAVWREAFDLDFFSSVRIVRSAVAHMKSGSRVVLLGAASAKQPRFEASPSNAAKAALANLTRSLADELAPRGILVNCVSPGHVLTERRRNRLEIEARKRGISPEEVFHEDAAHIPLGRLGDPEEVAAMVVFLASDRSSYITGQSIFVDGGLVKSI